MSQRNQLARFLESRERERKTEGFSAEALCSPAQLLLARSRAKRKVARCSRRAGKTVDEAIILLEGAREPPYANQGYITVSLKNAKRLIWPTLKKYNAEFNLGGVPNETEGALRFPGLPNEPNIYLGGVKDRGEIEKLRGWEGGVKRFVIDEAQSIRTSLLQEVIDDVIEPALLDYDGELIVSGTPGPVKAGYFHDIDIGSKRDSWEHFFWTLLENPFLEKKSGKRPEQILAELRERRGWTIDHPTYVREYRGLWVNDVDALVFRYDASRNDFVSLPPRMTYVMGVDLGFEDADAIAVLGWAEHDPVVYVVEETVVRKQSVTELADQVRALYLKYKPIKLVADFGGLGKKIAEEIRRRHALPVEAADKVRKLEHIALLNDALMSGRLKARATGAFAEDCALVQWDQDARALGTLKVAEDHHSDITDSVLYAFRACLGYLTTPRPPEQSHEQAYVSRLAAKERSRAAQDPVASFLGFDDD